MAEELTRARHNRFAVQGRGAPPFVGRVAELRSLQRSWRQACDRQVTLCQVCGEAGVGKTRLINQFARWVALQGGKSLMVRGDVPVNETIEQMHASLGARKPSPAAGTSAAQYWEESVESILAAVKVATSKQPALLVIDDYQLAQDAIRQLAHLIAVRMPRQPLLIVMIARSQRDLPPSAGSATAFRLSHMTDEEARQLISASSERALDPSITEAILARSTRLPLALLAWLRLLTREHNSERQAEMLAATAPSTLPA